MMAERPDLSAAAARRADLLLAKIDAVDRLSGTSLAVGAGQRGELRGVAEPGGETRAA
jgi:hypothetical protein